MQPTVFSTCVYTPLWRVVRGGLVAISRASLPLLLVLAVYATDPPLAPLQLLLLVVLSSLVPAAVARVMRRAFTARLEVHDTELLVRRADLEIAIPLANLVRLAPWTVPLPGPGLTPCMRAGGRLRYRVELDDPSVLLGALGDGPACAVAEAALTHPTVRYAQARAAVPRWRWYHYGWKFVGFGLLPTAIFFNAHQHIAYGGPLGEYHLLGLGAYLRTFALYLGTMVVNLVLFAALWRGLAEASALGAATVAPSSVTRVRRIAEIGCRVVYYAGVPALIAVRFLS